MSFVDIIFPVKVQNCMAENLINLDEIIVIL